MIFFFFQCRNFEFSFILCNFFQAILTHPADKHLFFSVCSMSNTLVPNIYEAVILKTIEKVRNYWEENGLDPKVLADIETEWQSKIVEANIAAFTEEQKLEQKEQMLILQSNKPEPKKRSGRKTESEETQSNEAQGDKKVKATVKTEGTAGNLAESDLFGDDNDDEKSEDNLDDLGLSDDEDDFETRNHIICQYEKVSRNKQRWKSKLRDGVIHVNGKDYIFQKADGEFDWV